MKTFFITCAIALLFTSDAMANLAYPKRGAGRREFVLSPSFQLTTSAIE